MAPASQEPGNRLIILGGGIAALTAAYYASEPNFARVFPGGIWVYEASSVLGGKGASTRTSNTILANRIEEHGLHVWFGFYDNAFALLSKCHEDLEKAARDGNYVRWSSSLRRVEDGFRPASRVALMDNDGTRWLPWVAEFPEDPHERPWESRRPGSSSALATPSALVIRALRLAEALLRSLSGASLADGRLGYSTLVDPQLFPFPLLTPLIDRLADALDRLLEVPPGTGEGHELLSGALRVVSRAAEELRNRSDETLRRHDSVRRGWYVVDMLLAAARGLIDEGVVASGDFALIDDLELREWLVLHGASEESVSSALLKGLVYDLAFAYEGGDPERPRCSAASGVYGLLRLLLTYRGAIMWKMNAGMGEIVFAPIYEALRRRGVRFCFGHRVDRIELTGDRATSIRFARAPRLELDELPRLNIPRGSLAGTLPYWEDRTPADEPRERVELELTAGDTVVYGLPVATIDTVLPNAPAAWQRCARHVKTVSTAALQLWLDVPVEFLAQWASPDITVSGYTEPFDTWSDMAVLAGESAADGGEPAKCVAYFTNVVPDGLGEEALEAAVAQFLGRALETLWPGYLANGGTFILRDSYRRLNETPSERYTISVPGSMSARLWPSDTSIRNVRPVGDWTRNDFNAGCIEAAVISGMLAARVLRPDRPLPIHGHDF